MTFEADGSAASLVSAMASTSGGPTKTEATKTNDDGTETTSTIDDQSDQVREYAGSQSTITDSKGNQVKAGDTTKHPDTPKAKTSDGSITVAAAVAINIVENHADATIPAGLSITASGPLTVNANNDTGDSSNLVYGDTASAWGTETGSARVGVGAAVALNLVDMSADATIQSSAAQPTTIDAQGVTVNAGMRGASPMNTFGAAAISGAGADDIGLAGAVAINIVQDASQALIETGASVAANGGDLSVTSENNATHTTYAQPAGTATGGSLGIGASLGLNIVNVTTKSEIQDGAVVTDAGNVTVTADSSQTIDTWAENGAAGKVAIGAGIAIAIADVQTTARIGSAPQTLDASGDLAIGATGAFSVNSLANSATKAGATVGLGASVVVNVTQDSVMAALARDVQAGGAVSVNAAGISSSQATAVASSEGSSPDDEETTGSHGTADQQSQNQFDFANQEGGSRSPNVSAPPSSNSQMTSPSSLGQQ